MNLLPASIRKHPIRSILIFCFAFIFLFVWRNLYAPENDARLTAIRQAGYPITLSDLNSFYPAVPDSENAALVYLQAFHTQLFTNGVLDNLADQLTVIRGEHLPEDVQVELASILATNAPALDLLYSATNYSASRYPMDTREGFAVLLPHLAQVKSATRLLALEALAAASASDTNRSYVSLNAAMHAGDSLKNEPILISYLVRIACSAIVVKRLEQCLNFIAFQDDQLRSLQQQLAAADDSRWSARALAGERAFGLSIFIDRHIQQTMTRGDSGLGGFPTGLGGKLAMSAYKVSGLMKQDRNFYLNSMAKTIHLAEAPPEERIKAAPVPNMIPTNRFLIFSRMLLPALQRVLDRANEHSARIRVAETGLAIERFRLQHSGAVPETLNQLVPEFISAVPLDPYDSKPLRYKKLPQGYMVYSVGADQSDDGGAEPPEKKSGKTVKTTPTDVTFVVERK